MKFDLQIYRVDVIERFSLEEIRYMVRFVSMARYAKCRAEEWNCRASLMELVELSTSVNYIIW